MKIGEGQRDKSRSLVSIPSYCLNCFSSLVDENLMIRNRRPACWHQPDEQKNYVTISGYVINFSKKKYMIFDVILFSWLKLSKPFFNFILCLTCFLLYSTPKLIVLSFFIFKIIIG